VDVHRTIVIRSIPAACATKEWTDMSGYVLRRSLLSLMMLGAILVIGGGVLVAMGVPVWVPLVFSLLLIGLQYAINPALLQWLVPASLVPLTPDGDGYAIDHPVGAIVARRCREAGIPLVRLGIVDDGMPNAFTFGHYRGDARVWLTRGLLERLDERELDAVVSHEIGHVKHNDFIVMTFAAAIPILAYYVVLAARTSRNRNSLPVLLSAYAVYLVSTFVVLALARARETAADHHSCEVTGDGDALCSALIKIAYGMGKQKEAQEAEARELLAQARAGGSSKRQIQRDAARARARQRRLASMSVLGIADPNQAAAVTLALEEGVAPEDILGALRWEALNPWAQFQEYMSSHPIVVHRIADLERSGLPGAPTHWHAVQVEEAADDPQVRKARRRFAGELVVRFAAPLALVGALLGYVVKDAAVVGWCLLAGGGLLAVKALLRHPPAHHEPVDRVTTLLGRLDASPVSGLAVSLRGRIIGRAMPGYVLSPDLVLQDGSGFVPLLYRQPIPFSRALFALLKAGRYAEQEVLARGWYRRSPTPVVELRDISAADGTRTRSWQWAFDYLLGLGVGLAGLLVVAIGLSAH
jgi:Zn-dependent protease with chaperone function